MTTGLAGGHLEGEVALERARLLNLDGKFKFVRSRTGLLE